MDEIVAVSHHRRHRVADRKGRRHRWLRFLSRQRRAGLAAGVSQFADLERERHHHHAIPEEPRPNHQRAFHADRAAAQHRRRGSLAGARRGAAVIALGRLCALALAVVAAACTLARADDRYPSRVITIVVPLTPGTAIDIQARLYADGLAKRFGYQAVVVNRAGAGTLTGPEPAPTAPPNVNTVLLTNSP